MGDLNLFFFLNRVNVIIIIYSLLIKKLVFMFFFTFDLIDELLILRVGGFGN